MCYISKHFDRCCILSRKVYLSSKCSDGQRCTPLVQQILYIFVINVTLVFSVLTANLYSYQRRNWGFVIHEESDIYILCIIKYLKTLKICLIPVIGNMYSKNQIWMEDFLFNSYILWIYQKPQHTRSPPTCQYVKYLHDFII